MTQKTALAELYTEIYESDILSPHTKVIVQSLIKSKLPKERQDLIDANHTGQKHGCFMVNSSIVIAEQYVHEKFGI